MYYTCLLKLFGYTVTNYGNNIFNFNDFLKRYNLQSFQHRITSKLTLFGYSIYFKEKSPPILKQTLINVFNVKKLNYNLRNCRERNVPMANNIHGTLTFEYFFSKILKRFEINVPSHIILKTIKNFIFNNLNEIVNIFLKTFPKFNINLLLKCFILNRQNSLFL